ncbi:hypothetical protein [Lactobacillus gallinarum]|uniref:hypothetical protein n=1 Tax=Lactobacillus gallinarum TaxID=52242 RepID=UPI00388D0DA1
MNKLIAFFGGVVVGTVYSKQIKQVANEYREQVNQKEAKDILDMFEKQTPNMKLVGEDDSKSGSSKKIDGAFDPIDDYLR